MDHWNLGKEWTNSRQVPNGDQDGNIPIGFPTGPFLSCKNVARLLSRWRFRRQDDVVKYTWQEPRTNKFPVTWY